MAGRDPRCTVCKHDRRDDLDRRLLAGNRPADVFRDLAEGLGLKRASLYRHARSHLPVSLIGPAWVDGESNVGDVVIDLGNLRRSLIEQRAAALAVGNHSAALAAAQRIEAVSLSLVRDLRIMTEADVPDAAMLAMLGEAIYGTAQTHPEAVRDLADRLGRLEYRDELAKARNSLSAEVLELVTLAANPKE